MEGQAPFTILRSRKPASDEDSMGYADSAYGSLTEGSPAATHDISRVKYHIKHIESFAQALENSASRAFPNRGRDAQRYSKVHALMLHWQSDDLFVLPELEDLEKCFRKHYNFSTDIFAIPSENPHLELMLKIADMVKKYEAEETLFVVYYGGHAKIDESRQSTWCANRMPGSPWLQWSAIQTLLERSISDVLILLDCCAGAASATFATGRSITETISASSWDAIAPDPGRYSFTNALIEVLMEWRQRTFSAAMLHAEILARLKHPRPILINGKHFEARTTPVHFMMTSNHKAASIELRQLVPRKAAQPSLGTAPASHLVSWNQPSPYPRMIEGRNPVEELPPAFTPPDFCIPAASDPNEDEPHVLISLALEDDQTLDLKDWENWLAAFPAIAKHVKVQGVFKSHSTLLLLSLPVMVWDFLPDDPACSFVAFIRSNNLLHARKQPAQAPHHTVAPAASEASAKPAGSAPDSMEGAGIERPPSMSSHVREDGETSAKPAEDVPAATDVVTAQPRLSSLSQLRDDESDSVFAAPLPQTSQEPPAEYTLASPLSQQRPALGLTPQPSMASFAGTLREMPSLQTLDQRQLSPPAPVSPAAGTLFVPGDGPSRMMSHAPTFTGSAFRQETYVSADLPIPPHVIRQLEEYFTSDPAPSATTIGHLASSLGVEPFDLYAWFEHHREEAGMTLNLEGLRAKHHHSQARADVHMILPGHLNRLLQIYPSKGVLLVDLRSTTDFERSHIHDAINLRTPLSFVEHTSLEMIEDTIMDDQSRRSFSKWSRFKCLVFYDRVIEFSWECPVAEALHAKFRRKGWQGQCFILKGHYREFSSSFDKYISGAKMTTEAKEYIDSLRQMPSPTEEESRRRDAEYREWLIAFTSQVRTHTADLIPAKKLERRRAVEQRQKELEVEFEARFPALYKKAQSMRSTAGSPNRDSQVPPSWSPPPPSFHSESSRISQSYKNADDWAGAGPAAAAAAAGNSNDDRASFDHKAPLVGPLASALDKMREAGNPPRPESGTSLKGYTSEYAAKGRREICPDEYDHDYDEIDPNSEGLGNDPVFQKAGLPSAGPEVEAGGSSKGMYEKGGEEALRRVVKRRPTQIWERLRGK
ncbi:hypothetical protein VTJ83DRAFT_2614 [Remersonia thermophila]|uniref:Tyrosine-protein phosphatase non-receptor type 6 n=1 Tax=Remersonia thermophila TaxID=72144 RepID=A0ABR4DJA2_9PEZI